MNQKRLFLLLVIFLSLSAFAQNSSTDFTYSNLKLSSNSFNGKITATVIVTNSGNVAGKEVVQLSLSSSADSLDKLSEELIAFSKTNLLQPGKSQTITFTLNDNDLTSFDTELSLWIAKAGKYTVKISSSSAKLNLSATFNLANDIVVERDHNVLQSKEQLDDDKPANVTGAIMELNDFVQASK